MQRDNARQFCLPHGSRVPPRSRASSYCEGDCPVTENISDRLVRFAPLRAHLDPKIRVASSIKFLRSELKLAMDASFAKQSPVICVPSARTAFAASACQVVIKRSRSLGSMRLYRLLLPLTWVLSPLKLLDFFPDAAAQRPRWRRSICRRASFDARATWLSAVLPNHEREVV